METSQGFKTAERTNLTYTFSADTKQGLNLELVEKDTALIQFFVHNIRLLIADFKTKNFLDLKNTSNYVGLYTFLSECKDLVDRIFTLADKILLIETQPQLKLKAKITWHCDFLRNNIYDLQTKIQNVSFDSQIELMRRCKAIENLLDALPSFEDEINN